ncbi:MAG TPA: carboxypeptidase regulatory-like domain-containing protein [Bryobacteraceae bacterium]|nr:carboxypeptidase regulatory-like domain-containing protein [Bryobacteraceae bacterium]
MRNQKTNGMGPIVSAAGEYQEEGMFRSRWFFGAVIVSILALCLFITPATFAQSTASITGTVTDPTGAIVPNATVTVRNQATGEERTTQTDSAGNYQVPSLPVGTYRVEVKATGMQTMAAADLPLNVGSTVRQDFNLKVAATSETIEITATAPVINSSTVSVGSVVNQATVQEMPLNGRHFIDLTLLTAGTVTPPANGFLTAPLRGQGSFAFNSAGLREDMINYQINGVNLSDPVQNQITFQPTINTVSEFKLDNSTFSAEYGRNAGSIVNIATRSGSNEWHGELYYFMRNSYFDARNFTNPTHVLAGGNLVPNLQAPFKRNQFGADGGGAIKKDKTFFYLSYEGLIQRQSVPLSSLVLTDAQRAQVLATSDPIVKSLLQVIPAANSGPNQYVSGATANVDIHQGTANVSHNFTDSNRLNVYYALQHDLRGEPPTTQANTLPQFGDQREGRRQIMTINDTEVFSPNVVNEARLGYNRIHITFNPDEKTNANSLGISNGLTSSVGLPQIIVQGGQLEFGTANGFPQGRGDYSAVASDTLSWTHGKHNFKFGGEYRRIDNNNFAYQQGTYTFPSVAAFIADQATGFTANATNGSSRVYVNSAGAFALDQWKISRNLTLDLGVRYDWYGTPTEAGNRFVVWDQATNTLQHSSQPYHQSALNFQPRVGFAWDVFGTGKTVVRSAYAIMTDQPITGIVTGLATNPPYAFPVSFAPTTAVPFVTLANAYPVASGSAAPVSITPDYRAAYVQSYNFNVQQEFRGDIGVMVGYFGNKGTNLNVILNENQPINGVRPYAALSANSPILPGKALSNILVQQSASNSNYNALWLTVTKRLSKGLQLNGDYTWSKSLDDNSRTNNGAAAFLPQNSYNLEGDYGPSDYDVRHRFAANAIYTLPFKGNRFTEGWSISTIVQLQTGNPLNFHTTNSAVTGLATLRPSVTGPVQTGFSPATTGSATAVTYIQNPSVFYYPGNAFGNLGRNAVTGPGFSNIDLALWKDTKITERITWQIRADAFDLLNHANFFNPVLTVPTTQTLGAPIPSSSTFGLITSGTRFTAGDFGTSRQIQLAMKLIF